MSISKNLKKILLTGAALLMVVSAGASLNTSNANAKRRYHYRTHRVYRHRVRRHTKKVVKRRARRIRRRTVRKTIRYRKSARRTQSVWPSHRVLAMCAKHNGVSVREFMYDMSSNFGLFGKPTSQMKPYLSSNNVAQLFSKNQLANYKREDSDPIQKFTGGNFRYTHKYHSHKAHVDNTNEIMRNDTFKYLNQDRANEGEGPLNEDSTMDQVAQKRAWQLDHVGFTHTDSNGNGYASGMDPDISAENIAEMYGYMSGKDAAKSMNKMLFYNEKSSDGGHYENILHGGNNVGIGAYNDNGSYYLAEDFGN